MVLQLPIGYRINSCFSYDISEALYISDEEKQIIVNCLESINKEIDRNVKYEKIYLNPPKDGMDLYLLLAEYFDYYNHERRHQSIDYERPIDLFKRAA